jgi:hypothetical protein
MDISGAAFAAVFLSLHLAIPIFGILWVAVHNERKKLKLERQAMVNLVRFSRGRKR